MEAKLATLEEGVEGTAMCLDAAADAATDAGAAEDEEAAVTTRADKSQYQTFLKMFGSGKETLDNWQEARAAVATIAASSRTQINKNTHAVTHVTDAATDADAAVTDDVAGTHLPLEKVSS